MSRIPRGIATHVKNSRTHLCAWSLAVSLLAGCAGLQTAEPPPEMPVLRRHNWWDYYERGRQYLQRGENDKARADFETALGLRGARRYGYPKEAWRARTYGMHMVEGYFPHRELAVCLYELGETEEAIQYLETSLAQVPSGRAKHYLNRSRERMLRDQPRPPPRVQLDPPAPMTWTRERTLTITGRAEADAFVREILINGRPEFLELAEREVPFSRAVGLQEGSNVINVAVRDLKNQEGQASFTAFADWTPPQIFVERARKQTQERVLDVVCVDDQGLASVEIDGQSMTGPGGPGTVEKIMRLSVSVAADRPVFLRVRDLAGNEIDLVLSHDSTKRMDGSHAVTQWAMLEADARVDAGSPEGMDPSPAADADCIAPRIDLPGREATVKLFNEEYWLDVHVEDPGGLNHVRVNGQDLLPQEARGSIQAHAARRVSLEIGTNVLSVRAADVEGNEAVVHVVVVRRLPEYLDTRYRLSLAVAPVVDDTGEIHLGERIKRRMEHELVRNPVRFYVVDRETAWRQIGVEGILSLSTMGDPRARLWVGSLLPVEIVLLGRVLRDGEGRTILASVMDVERGEVLCEEDVYLDRQTDLAYQVAGLVMKVEQQFPLVTSRISRLRMSSAVVDAGERDGVRPGLRFLIVQTDEGAESPDSGRVLLVKDRLAEVVVSRVAGTSCEGRIVPASAKSQVKTGDFVAAR
ncbi:MAG: hypothetical protein JXB04_12885 [Kiritimatiellae bacterium]|nr:hypothetical protein [Kiritimatiellia bacterium]